MMRMLVWVFFSAGLFATGYVAMDRYQQRFEQPPMSPVRAQGAVATSTTAADGRPTLAATDPVFEDVAVAAGLDFVYDNGAAGEFFIMETTGGGMAVFDADLDGRLDLFLVNGATLPPDPNDKTRQCRFYRQSGVALFANATDPSGLGVTLYGQGAAAGDFDNDGFDDLVVAGVGECVAFRNNGDGTFQRLPASAGIASTSWNTSLVWADLDRDGDLDLYVCTYGDVDLAHPIRCGDVRRVHCHPRKYVAQQDLLFINRGNGTFDEGTQATGIIDTEGRGLGVVAADLDNDRLPDLFVANDTSEAFLWRNETSGGTLRFRNIALDRGVALNGEGATMSGMGVACADYDHNGWLDLYVTDFFESHSSLFQNLGPGGFVETSGPAGLSAPSRDRLGWGALFIDADLDGWPDLFVTNGHVSDFGDRPYQMPAQFFMNRQDGTFREVSTRAGVYFQKKYLGRGAAAGDFDNNGLADVVVSHLGENVSLLLNRNEQAGNWIGLHLVGRASNRNGRNSRVTWTVEGTDGMAETVAGGGYLSSSDDRLLIGLGSAVEMGPVRVEWASGRSQTFDSLMPGQYHVIAEDLGARSEAGSE